MAGRSRTPPPPTLMDKVERAYGTLLDKAFPSITNDIGTSEGSGTPVDDAPPIAMSDQLKLLSSINNFVALKHRLFPEDDENALDGFVHQLRGETIRQTRRAKAENGRGGTPAILHRADEPTFGGASDDE
jgi:hypothetical protein